MLALLSESTKKINATTRHAPGTPGPQAPRGLSSPDHPGAPHYCTALYTMHTEQLQLFGPGDVSVRPWQKAVTEHVIPVCQCQAWAEKHVRACLRGMAETHASA